MREFEFPIEDQIKAGIKPYRKTQRNVAGLETLINAKCGKEGLVPFESINDRRIGVTPSWPFPQLFVGGVYRLLADSATVYEISSTWTKTSKLTSLSTDDIWDFIDFGDYWVLLNGAVIAYYDVENTQYANMASSSTFPRILTGTNLKGRIVGGNVKTSWHDCGTQSVVWSKIGSVDFTPDRTNTAGYRQTLFDGDVKRVMALNDVAMAYCENGIMRMTPSGTTFGFKDMKGLGVPAKGAAGGDHNRHVFVDRQNFLWRAEGNGELKKLGYQDEMATLTAASIVVAYDPLKQEFYIGDGSKSYLLTDYGLSQVWQSPTSVDSVDGDTVGVAINLSNMTFELVTDDLDFGSRGLKSIGQLELGADYYDDYAKLLLHCDGVNNATTFTDSSPSEKTVTPSGSFTDTDIKKFGTASAHGVPPSYYLSIADSDDWDFGTGPGTIDFWIYITSATAGRYMFGQYVDDNNFVGLKITTNDAIEFTAKSGGSDVIALLSANSTISENTWYHIAIVRGWAGENDRVAMTVDGTSVANGLMTGSDWPSLAAALRIGSRKTDDGTQDYIDEFRWTKGIARWVENFSVATAQYPIDTLQAAVAYRMTRGGAFTNMTYRNVNNEAVGHIGIRAEEFKLKVKATDYRYLDLDYLKPHVKFDDNRFRRGVGSNASQGVA